jgi:hypothetical protein
MRFAKPDTGLQKNSINLPRRSLGKDGPLTTPRGSPIATAKSAK